MVDWQKSAQQMVEALGGNDNIEQVMHCIIRLRFILKDEKAVRDAEIQKIDGVVKAFYSGGQYQVCIGNRIQDAYAAVLAQPGMEQKAASMR